MRVMAHEGRVMGKMGIMMVDGSRVMGYEGRVMWDEGDDA